VDRCQNARKRELPERMVPYYWEHLLLNVKQMVATVKFNVMVLLATVGALMVKEINEWKLKWDVD
jgi:hypothetical protein